MTIPGFEVEQKIISDLEAAFNIPVEVVDVEHEWTQHAALDSIFLFNFTDGGNEDTELDNNTRIGMFELVNTIVFQAGRLSAKDSRERCWEMVNQGTFAIDLLPIQRTSWYGLRNMTITTDPAGNTEHLYTRALVEYVWIGEIGP